MGAILTFNSSLNGGKFFLLRVVPMEVNFSFKSIPILSQFFPLRVVSMRVTSFL